MEKFIKFEVNYLKINDEETFNLIKRKFSDFCRQNNIDIIGKVKITDLGYSKVSFDYGFEHILEEGFDVAYSKEEEYFSCPYCDEYIYKIDYPYFDTYLDLKNNKHFHCPLCNGII